MAGPLAFAGGRSKPDAKLVAKVRGWGEAEMTAQVRAAPRHGGLPARPPPCAHSALCGGPGRYKIPGL